MLQPVATNREAVRKPGKWDGLVGKTVGRKCGWPGGPGAYDRAFATFFRSYSGAFLFVSFICNCVASEVVIPYGCGTDLGGSEHRIWLARWILYSTQ